MRVRVRVRMSVRVRASDSERVREGALLHAAHLAPQREELCKRPDPLHGITTRGTHV